MNNWIELVSKETRLQEIQETNQYTEKYGLALTQEDTQYLIAERSRVLKEERRVEFGETILPKIIFAFCDSSFLFQANYRETLARLQEIFYAYKNEMMDLITDDELLTFMREQFDTICMGDLDYLEGTCLDLFAQAIRTGYSGYQVTGGKGEFSKVDLVERWDRDLYLDALANLFGG